VNKEISELINALINSFHLIPIGGVIAVVTFHSIEDKIVKFFFKHYSEERNSSRYMPNEEVSEKCFKIIDKKPILPSSKEISQNPPSRSAKLRYGIKINHKCNFNDLREKFKYLTDVEELK
jgi:Predicted S-adenosylmethionine-dependent methyltransferase involved in cell envelope biogenesis